MSETEISLTKAQTGFMSDNSRHARFIGGIGSGKSFILTLWALSQALQGRIVLYILPTFSMIKDIAMPCIEAHIDLLDVRGSCSIVQNPPTLRCGKGMIMFRSGETGSRLRGTTVHDVALDEAAFISPDVYRIVLGRARAGTDNKLRMVSTPAGAGNWFSKLECSTYNQSTFANPFITNEFKEDLLQQYSDYSDDFVQQELYGKVTTAENSRVFIKLASVIAAQNRTPIVDYSYATIMGLDVARSEGGDASAITVRQGKRVLHHELMHIPDLVDLANKVANYALMNNVDYIVVDAPGPGGGVIDILNKQLDSTTVTVIEFWGNATASDHKIGNLRAECYLKAKNWIESDGYLPPCEDWQQLAWTESIPHSKGKLMMEPKTNLKRRGLHSPDLADSFTLSFAAPDYKESSHGDPYAANNDYCG